MYNTTLTADTMALASEFRWQPSEINALSIQYRQRIAFAVCEHNRKQKEDMENK